MVMRTLRAALVAATFVVPVWVATPARAHAQTAVRVKVGVRPSRVRVGDTFIVTVRVAGPAWPEVLDLDSVGGAQPVSYRDRTSTGLGSGGRIDHVLERDFVMKATRPGRVTPPRALLVLQGDTSRPAVPAVQAVGSPLAWNRSAPVKERRAEAAPGAQGKPPTAKGRDADRERAPWGLGPYGTGPVPYGSVPYGGIPYGAGTGDSVPYGGVPYGGLPYGALPYGGLPYGGLPYGTIPSGGIPYGAVPNGGIPSAGVPYGGLPYAGVPRSGYSGYSGYSGHAGVPYARTDSTGRRRAGAAGYGPSGWGLAPLGRDWAATATGDPWWPELVPRLERYATSREGPDGLVGLEAGITPERVYVGQQVTLVATATFLPEALTRMRGQPEFFPPTAGSAWSVEIPYGAPTPSAVRGRTAEAHTFMRAFFPVEPGRLDVGGARLTFAMGGRRGDAGSTDTLVTDPMSLNVLPVPRRGAPPEWRGAVGRFKVAAWLQPSTVEWGRAALLTVEVSGAGNVRLLQRPDPGPLDGAELRPAGERAVVEVRDGVVGGVKTFTWLVVPMEAGPVRVGPVLFAYFDPWLGTFAQVASDELLLHALPLGETAPAVDSRGGTATPAPGAGGGMPPGTASEPSAAPGGSFRTGRYDGSSTGSRLPMSGTGGAPATFSASADSQHPGASEAAASRLRTLVERDPSNAAAWLALGKAYARSRPGEGWAQWAWASGLLHAPRDARLSAELRSAPEWGGWKAARTRGAEGAVVVGSAGDVRVEPTWTSTAMARLTPGSPVRLGERYGRWVRVQAAGGLDGWMEWAAVAPLTPRSPRVLRAPGPPARGW